MFSKINVFYHVGVLKNNKINFFFLENVPLKSFQKKKKVSFQNNKVSIVTFYFKHFSQNSCKDLCSRLILLSLGTPFKLTLSLPFLGTNDLSLSSFFCMIKKEKKKERQKIADDNKVLLFQLSLFIFYVVIYFCIVLSIHMLAIQ